MKVKLMGANKSLEGSLITVCEVEIDGKKCIINIEYETVIIDHWPNFKPSIKLWAVEGMEKEGGSYSSFEEYLEILKRSFKKNPEKFIYINSNDEILLSELVEGEEIELGISHFDINQDMVKVYEKYPSYKETLQKLIDLKMQELSSKRKIPYYWGESEETQENIERGLQQYKEKLKEEEYIKLRNMVYSSINTHKRNHFDKKLIKYDSEKFLDEDIQKIIEMILNMIRCVKNGKYDETDLANFIEGSPMFNSELAFNVVDVALGNAAVGYMDISCNIDGIKSMRMEKKHGDIFSLNKNYLSHFSSIITGSRELFPNNGKLNKKCGSYRNRLVCLPVIEVDKPLTNGTEEMEPSIVALCDSHTGYPQDYHLYCVTRGFGGGLQLEEMIRYIPEELKQYTYNGRISTSNKELSHIVTKAVLNGRSLRDVFAEEMHKNKAQEER